MKLVYQYQMHGQLYRAGVRTKAAEMKTAVSAVTSIGALKDLHVVYDTDNSIASGILYNFVNHHQNRGKLNGYIYFKN